jgi:23S rRNA (pseudouridine1915-N3)-methyltransferase
MRLRIVALGHRTSEWVTTGFDDYARRMPRDFAIELVELKPEPRGRGKPLAKMLDAEAARIAAACRGTDVFALDERGSAWTTRELAARIARHRDAGRDVSFVIGSADGLAPAVKTGAAAVVSLSPLTLPHGLVRVIVAEQLYRAATLIGGHPYHRG